METMMNIKDKKDLKELSKRTYYEPIIMEVELKVMRSMNILDDGSVATNIDDILMDVLRDRLEFPFIDIRLLKTKRDKTRKRR